MTASPIGFARHLSIVWGITLAVITIVEWNSLDRDPMRKDILSPFIQREIKVSTLAGGNDTDEIPEPGSGGELPAGLTYEVAFDFNGPLFLAAFFLPVCLFHGIAWLLAAIRKS